jgi:hypothetical protein
MSAVLLTAAINSARSSSLKLTGAPSWSLLRCSHELDGPRFRSSTFNLPSHLVVTHRHMAPIKRDRSARLWHRP